jgi:hypothetical protein
MWIVRIVVRALVCEHGAGYGANRLFLFAMLALPLLALLLLVKGA